MAQEPNQSPDLPSETELSAPLPTLGQIDAILAFLPVFTDPDAKHSKLIVPPKELGKPRQLPWVKLSDQASAFYKALYEHGFVVAFSWEDWQDEAAIYFHSTEKLISAGLFTIRRLLTLHVRKDRFCDGHFAKMIEKGRIGTILEQLAVVRCKMEGGFVLDDRTLDTS